jgi:integrase/recombinase XerD
MDELIPLSMGFDTTILAGSVAPSSVKMYERDFKAFLAYAGTPGMATSAVTLARWRTHLATNTTLSPNTINRMLSAVKRLMDEAETQGYVPKGTSEDFRRVHGVKIEALKYRQKTHARVRIDPQDMRILTSIPDPLTLVGMRDSALLHTLASSGLRVDELATLTKGQISPRFVRVMGKNDKEYRNAPLSKEAHDAIEEWLERRPVDSEYLFTSFKGKGDRLSDQHMRPVSIWRTIKAYADQCGLEHIKPHDFRRFVGTQLAKTNPRHAQKALGHKKIGTTMDNYVLDELEEGLTDSLY